MGKYRHLSRALGTLLLLFGAWPALADQHDTADPGYREYDSISTPRAKDDKSPEVRAYEAGLFRARAEGCDRGDLAACGDLGESYELGIGAEQNRPIAALLYTDACDADDAESCYRLGRLTFAGTDTEVAQAEAAALFEKACALGSLEGCVSQAGVLIRGISVPANPESGIALLRETCGRGSTTACHDLAIQLINLSEEEASRGEAIGLLDRLCSDGYSPSCVRLQDFDLIYDPHPAQPPFLDVVSRACNLADAFSCIKLAEAAYRGQGAPQDRDYALALYAHACEIEDRSCSYWFDMRDVGEHHGNCQNGDMAACALAGRIFLRSDLPLQDVPLGRDLLQRACRAGETQVCSTAATEEFLARDYQSAEQLATIRNLLETGCSGGQLSSCDALRRELEPNGHFAEDRARANQLLALLCEGNYGDSCATYTYRYATEPDVPMIAAEASYVPPIDPDDEEGISAYLPPELRVQRASSCTTSTLTFRGKQYFDRVCDTKNRVIRGIKVKPGAAPWQALLWRPPRMQGRMLEDHERVACGGAMILEGWILTAAHCFRNRDGTPIARGHRFRLGVSNPRRDEGITYAITEVIEHPSFTRSSYAYDVALVRYNARRGRLGIDTNDIRRIRIDRTPVDERTIEGGETVIVYGWGLTAVSGSTSTDTLMSARLQMQSETDCTNITGLRYAQICAQGRRGQQACGGDSGGPLITYEDADRRPRVIAIVSAGKSCGTRGEASRYTRVGAVLSWIEEEMASRGASLPD